MKKGLDTGGQTPRRGWKLKNPQAAEKFGKYLSAVLKEATKEWDTSIAQIARNSVRDNGTSLSRQSVYKLKDGKVSPDLPTLKALARGLRGFTTYEKLLQAAGIVDPTHDTTPLPDRMRMLMLDEGVPADVADQVVGLLNFQLQQPASKRKRA